jgi:hypothetical protein
MARVAKGDVREHRIDIGHVVDVKVQQAAL